MTTHARREVSLGEAFIASLTEAELGMLALRLRPYWDAGEPRSVALSGWMDSAAAAEYLGMSRSSLHKLTARRAIPSHQEAPGCKHWFLRAELDRWREERSMS